MAPPYATAARTAHRAGEPARRATALAAALFLAVLPLRAQEPDRLQSLVTADAMRLVTDEDATVRGEAALVLGATKDARHHDAVLAVAKDDAPEARVRGLVALGMLGTPGCERVLLDAIADSQTRAKDDGIAAAFALGLLPPDHSPADVTRCLLRFLQSNFKRQRDVLVAMLVAMRGTDQKVQLAALQRILDDESNRDPAVRALLLSVLGATDGALREETARTLLERGATEERLAVYALLKAGERPFDEALVPLAAKAARHDPAPEVRAAALAFLTRMRHLPALDLAGRALKSSSPAEVEQGARSAMQLGGSGMRRAVEEHLASLTAPALRAAVLRTFGAGMSPECAAACIATAADRKLPLELRAAAAQALARSGDPAGAPVLRDAFREAENPWLLCELGAALVRLEKTPPELARLHGGSSDDELLQRPAHLAALLGAGHPEASRFAVERLQAKSTSAPQRAALLRAWRLGAQYRLAADRTAALPEPVAILFR